MPVNIIPSADYYENQDLHGSYQYITTRGYSKQLHDVYRR